jgi:hypothetical protein
MKIFLIVFLLFATTAYAEAPQTTTIGPQPVKEDYGKFIESVMTREALAECISQMDHLVDAGEHGVVDDQPDPGMVETFTRQGLHFEFSVTNIEKEAIVYYLTISRGGKELKYSEATIFAALFADRAGLPHPINITEGDKPVFYAQWLIKPSTWKSMYKMMLKVRTENRSEKDPLQAVTLAVGREMDARAETLRKRKS